jgi:methylenetetrahydrofolate reductase (NADPH)
MRPELVHASIDLLRSYSIEIAPRDERSATIAIETLPSGAETFIASLPKSLPDEVVATARRLRRGGLSPVPHIAARNLHSERELDRLLGRLAAEASVDRALLIGGDRNEPAGPYVDSLQILNSGLLEKHGIRTIYLPCYPEGHPRIDDGRLRLARQDKLAAAQKAGLSTAFVSQFCFEAAPIMRLALELRAEGIEVPLRVGIAGPVSSVTLLKYALLCGVGPSIRVLRERDSMAKAMIAGDAGHLLAEVALAQKNEPTSVIGGVHFFTFGAVGKTMAMIAQMRHAACGTAEPS